MTVEKQAKPRGFRTERCPVCCLPPASCVCKVFRKVPCGVRVHMLIHPNEFKRSSGTGFLAVQCLEGSGLLTPEGVNDWLAAGQAGPVALLFPPDGEELQAELPVADSVLPVTLIVPDGSWVEARRMVRKNPVLRALPRVSPHLLTERWIETPLRIDKWSRPCTAEALGLWLKGIGELEAAEQMKQSLLAFVNAHRSNRGAIRPGDPAIVKP